MLDKYALVRLLPYLLICTLLVGFFYEKTKPIIALQKYEKTQKLLNSVYPLNSHQTITTLSTKGVEPLVINADGQAQYWLVCNQHTEWDGVILPVRSREGYVGNIDLLIALSASYNVLGVNVLQHTETPGLGDKLEPRRSNWLEQFVGEGEQSNWVMETSVKEGFDGLTAATITSQAVINVFPKMIAWTKQMLSNFKRSCLHRSSE